MLIISICLIFFGYLLGAKSSNIPKALVWRGFGNDCIFMDFGCNKEEIKYGAYDKEDLLKDSEKIAIDHYYFSWLDFDILDFQKKVENSKNKNRSLFITIEPWAKTRSKANTLLKDITLGEYDTEIKKICTELNNTDLNIELSFAHEMDHDLTERYDWSGKDKTEFINAYRYFVTNCKKVASEISYVWSPVGDKKALEYWPGEEFVDSVGFPVYSFPDFDILYYDHARSFVESTQEKYDRLATLKKPMIIVEVGVAGDNERKTKWIKEMYENINKFPLIKSMLFFNAVDHEGAWGKDLSTPDWRITKDLI